MLLNVSICSYVTFGVPVRLIAFLDIYQSLPELLNSHECSSQTGSDSECKTAGAPCLSVNASTKFSVFLNDCFLPASALIRLIILLGLFAPVFVNTSECLTIVSISVRSPVKLSLCELDIFVSNSILICKL